MRAKIRGRSKYGAVKTVIDGITFASKKEAKRYAELKLLEKAGEISALELQPEYALHAATNDPDAQPIGVYRADFSYVTAWKDRGWTTVVEDVKGGKATMTDLWRWKVKHLKLQYGIKVTVV